MWRVWLLGGYAAGFVAAVFLAWIIAGGDVPLTPRDVVFGGFLALLLHAPALAEVRFGGPEVEVAAERWVFQVGEWRVAHGAAAFGAAGVAVAVLAYWALAGTDYPAAAVLVPPLALLLAHGWVRWASSRAAKTAEPLASPTGSNANDDPGTG